MNLNDTENIYKQYIRGSNGQKGNKVLLRTNEYTETASEISSLVCGLATLTKQEISLFYHY
jgi:hypothetical protein